MEKEADVKLAEEKRLKDTIEIVKEQIETITSTIEHLHENTTDPYTQANLQKMYLDRKRNLESSKDKPYFARIDFKETSAKEASKIYIGKANVDDDSNNLIVVDWRAPIASLYYDGRLGKVSYDAPAGNIQGDLLLKRLFEIEQGRLEGFSDIDISASDELLKPYLTSNSEVRLKNIISTIQTEQNAIIRAPLNRPLIVQGVAGSGKTTVALHRIAYLAYTYAKQLQSKDVMIIAPNKFFLDYISNILPDLGVNDVNQCTFEEFAEQIIDAGIKVESSTDKLANMINNHGEDKKNEGEQAISTFKSSLEFKEILDKYLQNIEEHYLPEGDLKAGDITILRHEKLVENFKECLKGKALEEKLKMFKARLKMFFENNQDLIEDMIRKQRTKEIESLDKSLPQDEYKKKRLEIFEKYDEPLEMLKNNGKKLIDDYVKRVKKPNPLVYYRDFISKLPQYAQGLDIDEKIIKGVQDGVLSKKNKQVEYEDLAPLMYIASKIRGNEKQIKNNQIYPKHIVVDEAQDYSPFQFFVLKDILKSDSMTILGDISQGIYSYRGTNDWTEINDRIFDGKANILDLSKSYRTTMEIMEKGNDVIDKIRDRIHTKLAEPVIREGDPVTVTKQEEKQLAITIANRINELVQDKRTNIAVITKTLQEAKDLYKKITKKGIDATLISDKSKEYNGGVSIIPSYLVKGLEFDSVILPDAGKEQYGNNELDAKLLYVAITRAMHTLDIYYTKERTELLNERKKEKSLKEDSELEER